MDVLTKKLSKVRCSWKVCTFLLCVVCSPMVRAQGTYVVSDKSTKLVAKAACKCAKKYAKQTVDVALVNCFNEDILMHKAVQKELAGIGGTYEEGKEIGKDFAKKLVPVMVQECDAFYGSCLLARDTILFKLATPVNGETITGITTRIKSDSLSDDFAKRGLIYLGKKQLKKAKADLEKSIELDRLNVLGRYGLALCLEELRMFPQAVEEYNKLGRLTQNEIFPLLEAVSKRMGEEYKK